jgi:large subunit ribosomal protein L21
VQVGEQLVIDRQAVEAGEVMTISDVLLIGGDKVAIGTPLVEGASVTLKVLEHGKGEKIRVATYKAKSRYRRVKGHRSHQTTVEVTGINA